jgi:hypothetical protein
MKSIYKFTLHCGRSGELHGIFTAEKTHIDLLLSSKTRIYFGDDILGKHSEVTGVVEPHELVEVSSDPELVCAFETNHMEHGYNPFTYDEVKEIINQSLTNGEADGRKPRLT